MGKSRDAAALFDAEIAGAKLVEPGKPALDKISRQRLKIRPGGLPCQLVCRANLAQLADYAGRVGPKPDPPCLSEPPTIVAAMALASFRHASGPSQPFCIIRSCIRSSTDVGACSWTSGQLNRSETDWSCPMITPGGNWLTPNSAAENNRQPTEYPSFSDFARISPEVLKCRVKKPADIYHHQGGWGGHSLMMRTKSGNKLRSSAAPESLPTCARADLKRRQLRF